MVERERREKELEKRKEVVKEEYGRRLKEVEEEE